MKLSNICGGKTEACANFTKWGIKTASQQHGLAKGKEN